MAQDIENFKSDESITMFGVHFSETYFVGKENFSQLDSLGNEYFLKWNTLFLEEFKKYNIEKSTNKKNVKYSLDKINSINSQSSIEDVRSRIVDNIENSKLLTLEHAEKMALSYELEGETRYGIIFFATEYNKTKKRGFYYVVILDLERNVVIYKDLISGKSKGFGLRNYWAYTFYESLDQLKKKLKSIK